MTDKTALNSNKLTPVENWVTEYGDYLYRYVYYRLQDSEQAEDLVQETFLAALKARHNFSGNSSVKTWLVGILKRKIVDYYRKKYRHESKNFDPDQIAISEDSDSFGPNGHWQAGEAPHEWTHSPQSDAERSEFYRLLMVCLDGLTPQARQVFQLRELDDLDTETICETLGINPSNLWVILHRARKQLRKCLEQYYGT